MVEFGESAPEHIWPPVSPINADLGEFGEFGEQRLVLHDDGGAAEAAARQCRSSAVELVLRYALPEVATGVAVLGLGSAARPLARLSKLDGEFERLGALPPARVVELLGPVELATRVGVESLAELKDEVRELQIWRDRAGASVASLERRAALVFLGLEVDAEPEAVQKKYKQRALALHPDKGGSEEDFMQLQEMHCRLQAEADEGKADGKKGNIFEQFRKLKEEQQEVKEDLPEEVKVKQTRALLSKQALDLWQRATAAQRGLTDCRFASARCKPAIALLHQFVSRFRHEAESLPRGPAAVGLAERLLWKFVRQGLEVLAASALTDLVATVAHVSSHFTGLLLRVTQGSGPCISLRRHCGALLAAIGEIPRDFDAEFRDILRSLEDQAAAEWLGCDENASPAERQKEAERRSKLPKPAAEPAPAGAPNAGEAKAPVTDAVALLAPDELVAPGCPAGMDAASYQESEAWRKLRAYCVRHRFCVDFNRDSSGARCTIRFGECGFKHACAVCGAADTGGPGAQYQYHGAWNCLKLQSWLKVYK